MRSLLEAAGLDALVVTSLPNILFLSNFAGSSAIVVISKDDISILTDFRYVAAIESTRGTPAECRGMSLVTVDGSYDGALAAFLGRQPGTRVGFEAAHLSVGRYNWLISALSATGGAPVALVPTEGIVEQARLRKDPYEIEVFREAGRRLSRVAAAVLDMVRPGQTELEVAFEIDSLIKRGGFERTSFETIVASGPNAALPHARPTERRLGEGDLVVLDFGGVYASYCVDLTRTVCMGPATARAREVYGAVLEAHDRAIASVRPGVSRFAIDDVARQVLGRAGMAEAFGHGTGHGLGIEIHEDPRVTRRRPDVSAVDEFVSEGMVFTVEPGAYFPGWGGVRIEDDVLVTPNGVECLTEVTTVLREIRC